MTTQLAIDDALINEALTLGQYATKEDVVITALHEFINRRKQQNITQLFNKANIDTPRKIILGIMEGRFSVSENFDDALPEHIENMFYSENL